MDFMRLFKSLEELLYEVIVILVFFPKTFWLTLRYPQRMMDYSDTELGDVLSQQYNDTLSPPLFLMLCVTTSYLVDRALPGALDLSAVPALLQDSQNLLALRVLVFSLFPLAFSLRLLRGLGQPLDRETLRAPFFAQCFVAAPLAMTVGLAQALGHLPIAHADMFAALLLGMTAAWYLRQQACWFHIKLALPMWRCWAATIVMTFAASIVFIMIALAIVVVNQ